MEVFRILIQRAVRRRRSRSHETEVPDQSDPAGACGSSAQPAALLRYPVDAIAGRRLHGRSPILHCRRPLDRSDPQSWDNSWISPWKPRRRREWTSAMVQACNSINSLIKVAGMKKTPAGALAVPAGVNSLWRTVGEERRSLFAPSVGGCNASVLAPGLDRHVSKFEAVVVARIEPCAEGRRLPHCGFVEFEIGVARAQPIR